MWWRFLVSTKRRLVAIFSVIALALSLTSAAFASFRANVERPWFVAHLSGQHEVPPVDSAASGVAMIHYDAENDVLRYRIKVENLDGVVSAHIHHAPAGRNGNVVAVLLDTLSPPAGPVDGVLVTGFITPDDLTGDFAGDWDTFVRALYKERLYVNVHTQANPAGEIRGQLIMKGPHGPSSPPASRPASPPMSPPQAPSTG